jgi:oligopeptide/dipeptide ABC transporter ATP-binding protein
MDKELLRIQDLKICFETQRGILNAVDGVNLTIDKNEVIGLVGESGCGKTMTALSILGLVPTPGKIVDGQVIFKKRNLLELNKQEMNQIRGNEISMIFQDPMTFLNPVMRVETQIAQAIRIHTHGNKKKINSQVIKALKDVGIPSPLKVAKYYPNQLSGGMRQRVLIAMALSCNPTLIIADEPTTNLDVTIQSQILELLKLIRKSGASLMIITHDLGVVADICDRVYVMYAGKILEYSDVYTIYKNPKHPYTRGLLKSTMSIGEFKKEIVGIDGTVPDPTNLPLGCRFNTRCPQAREICFERYPPNIEINPGHIVTCWLYN